MSDSSDTLDIQRSGSIEGVPPPHTIRRQRPWYRRVLRRLVVTMFGMLLCGFLWDQIASQIFLSRFPPTGEFVTVDNARLHMVVAGNREPGMPALIIAPGLGDGVASWSHIIERIKEKTQVVVAEARGLGYSGGLDRDMITPEQNLSDLRSSLEQKGIQPPYVLVGHSAGGQLIRMFQTQAPNEIAGLLFIDSLYTDHLRATQPPPSPPGLIQLYSIAGRFGLPRILSLWLDPFPADRGLDLDRLRGIRNRGSYASAVIAHWRGAVHEWQGRRDSLNERVDVPTTVISAQGIGVPSLRWSEGQKALQTLSSDSKVIDVPECHHVVQMDQPDLVVDEILDLLDRVKERIQM